LNKRKKTLIVLFILSSLLLSYTLILQPPQAYGYEVEDVKAKIREAFRDLVNAEKEGANITKPIQILNKALELTSKANKTSNPDEKESLVTQALTLISSVEKDLPKLIEEGRQSIMWKNINLYLTLGITAFLSILLYVYLPRLVWRAWVKLRKHWIVKKI